MNILDHKTTPQVVRLQGLHMASVKGPHGSHHHILVNPTHESVVRARAWHKSGKVCTIEVIDRGGTWTRSTLEYAIEVVADNGCLIITTQPFAGG
jgi:hypothetical protein